MTRQRIVTAIFVLIVASGCCFLALKHYYFVLTSGQPASDPDLVVYQVDDVHRLVVGRDAALLINTQERVVLELPWSSARRLGPVLFWPRDVLRGVVLGDGVKGDERDSYRFGNGGVDIRYGPGDKKRDLHVSL